MDTLGALNTTPTLAPPVVSGRSDPAEQTQRSANPQASTAPDSSRAASLSVGASDHRKSVDPADPSSANQPLKDPRRAERASSSELSQTLEQAQQKEIQALSLRDREVREHERMHARVGGAHAAAPEYELTRGPDGRYYATGGKVRIDTSPIANDPQATLEKAEIIKRAALSVPEPSSEDRAVAALADQMMAEAKIELAELEKVGQVAAKAETVFAGENEEPAGQVSQVGPAGDEASSEQLDAARLQSEEQTRQAFQVGLSGGDDQSPVERSDKAAQEKAEKEEAREQAEAVSERVRENSEEMAEKRQAALAELQRYSAEMNQLQEHLKEVNNRLLEAGVFEKLLPKGSLLDLTV